LEKELIVKAIDYIKKGWTKGACARNAKGRAVGTCDEEAVAWCPIGAIDAAYPHMFEYRDACKRLQRVVGMSIDIWNDVPKRTKEEVLAAFKKAGI
jgi:hypothetical protein